MAFTVGTVMLGLLYPRLGRSTWNVEDGGLCGQSLVEQL